MDARQISRSASERDDEPDIFIYTIYRREQRGSRGEKLEGVVENKLKTAKEKHKQLGEQQKFADIKSVDCSSGRLGRQRRIK